jgi:hypothetical protein
MQIYGIDKHVLSLIFRLSRLEFGQFRQENH